MPGSVCTALGSLWFHHELSLERDLVLRAFGIEMIQMFICGF